jgi:hypothetical protein
LAFVEFAKKDAKRTYAALSNPRSSASINATKPDTSQGRSVTPAAIAGVARSVAVNLDEVVREVA